MALTWPKKDVEEKFPIGSKVRFLGCSTVSAETGATGIVVDYVEDSRNSGRYYIKIDWDRNGLDNGQKDGGYWPDCFDVVGSEVKAQKKACPRCGGELYKKTTEQYGVVDKCKQCGWC